MNYLGSILASSSTHWLAQLDVERKHHPLQEISLSLKLVRIPLMSISGCLGTPWSPQHGLDLQPLNLSQSQRLGLTGFRGRSYLLTVLETLLQSLHCKQALRKQPCPLSWKVHNESQQKSVWWFLSNYSVSTRFLIFMIRISTQIQSEKRREKIHTIKKKW